MSDVNTVVAKFNCQFIVEKYGSQFVKCFAIYPGPEASEEDKAFWSATPNGSIEMYVTNPATEGFFQEGKQYYVTFEPVDGQSRQ